MTSRTGWIFGAALSIAIALTTASGHAAEELTPQGALALAARQNLDLRASLADLRSAQEALRGAEDARTPVLFASAAGGYTERNIVAVEGLDVRDDKTLDSEVGVRFQTDIGTTIEVGAGTGLTLPGAVDLDVEAAFGGNASSGTASVFANVRQPLLRGAGTDAVLGTERQAASAIEASRATQSQTASEVARDVLLGYWELWYADRALVLQEDARTLAVRQRDEAKLRETQLGTVARRDVLRLEAELRSVETALEQARVNRATAAISLGRLLGVEEERAATFLATAPEPTPPAIGTQAVALGPPELKALEAQVRTAEDRVLVADDATLPRLDLGFNTSASTLFTEDRSGGTTGIPSDRPAFVARVTLDFELPLGGAQADAQHRQTVHALESARIRYEARAQAIRAEQATLAAQLAAAARKVSAAADTARLQAEVAQAERDALDLGISTTSEVVRTQQDARQAELARVRAVVDAEGAEIRFHHAHGTLLTASNGVRDQGER